SVQQTDIILRGRDLEEALTKTFRLYIRGRSALNGEARPIRFWSTFVLKQYGGARVEPRPLPVLHPVPGALVVDTADLLASLAFYEKVGFRKEESTEPETVVSRCDVRIALRPARGPLAGGGVEWVIEVHNASRLIAELQAQNVVLEQDLSARGSQLTFSVTDPS